MVAGWFENDLLRIEEVHRFANEPVTRADGTLAWNIEQLFADARDGLAKGIQSARAARRPAETIGIDSWGVDFGLLNAEHELIEAPVHYRDARTNGVMEELFLSGATREEIYNITGIQFLPFNTIYQLAALQKSRPEQLEKASHFLMIADLFAHMLTGEAQPEYSNATTTQLFDAAKANWSDKLITKLKLPRSIFGDVALPGGFVEPLRAEYREAWNANDVLVRWVATHDTASAVAAVPAEGDNFAYLSCGTWSLLGVEVRQPVITAESQAMGFTNEGGVGGTFRLLKNIMGLWLLQESRLQWQREGKQYDWAEIAAMADSAPALATFVDPDDARFLPPGDMPSRIRDFCRDTDQPQPGDDAALARCILESLALKYRTTIDDLEQLTGRKIEVLHMVGGGSQNELLCQWTANAIERPVISGPVEATAIGNIGLQMMNWHFEDIAEFRSCVAESFEVRVYEPDDTDNWNKALQKYRSIIKNSRCEKPHDS